MNLKFLSALAALGCVFSTASAATLCSDVSSPAVIDLDLGTRTAAPTETIRYSTAWETDEASAEAVVAVNGEELSSATGNGSVEWTPTRNGVYTLTHQVLVNGEPVGETLTASFVVEDIPLCSSVSSPVVIDLTPGTRTAAPTETIRYATAWETSASGAEAVIAVDGEMVNSATGSGAFTWQPTRNGTYTLTHRVMVDGQQVGTTLTATFEVSGLPAYTATQTTPEPVPYAWLRGFYPEISDEYEAYETAAHATAANGRPVWECYVAGLDPTDKTDDFVATIEMVNGVPQISVGGRGERSGSVYIVEGKENLGDSWGPTNATSRFFHLKVRVGD